MMAARQTRAAAGFTLRPSNVPTETTASDKPLQIGGIGEEDGLDPELASLPDPPRRERRGTLLVLAVTAVASLAMVASLARDAAYAFAAPSALDLGELKSAPISAFGPNAFIQARGLLAAAGAIRYERPLAADSFRVAPVAGRPDVYVEVRVPAGEESSRFVPPSDFRGRLVRFDDAGPRHRGLRRAIAERTGTPVPAGAWLIVNGEAPDHARWAVALVALFAAFALWNAAALARLTRKVR
jgi:hypothetical protein